MLKPLDIFSTPFQITIKQEKSLKTNSGGALSILVGLVSLAYLILLIVNWSEGDFIPKVTNVDVQSKDNLDLKLVFEKSPFVLDVVYYINGTSIPKNYYDI
jgi:hypothetical protein